MIWFTIVVAAFLFYKFVERKHKIIFLKAASALGLLLGLMLGFFYLWSTNTPINLVGPSKDEQLSIAYELLIYLGAGKYGEPYGCGTVTKKDIRDGNIGKLNDVYITYKGGGNVFNAIWPLTYPKGWKEGSEYFAKVKRVSLDDFRSKITRMGHDIMNMPIDNCEYWVQAMKKIFKEYHTKSTQVGMKFMQILKLHHNITIEECKEDDYGADLYGAFDNKFLKESPFAFIPKNGKDKTPGFNLTEFVYSDTKESFYYKKDPTKLREKLVHSLNSTSDIYYFPAYTCAAWNKLLKDQE